MLLEARSLSKSFGITRALDAVDFDLSGAETHVLFGENGAGKSTLVKILSGAYAPDAGSISVAGRPAEIGSPAAARALGIATVFQDFSLIPTISALDNLFLGKEQRTWGLLDRQAMRSRARQVCERLQLDIDLGRRVDRLGRADQQMLEIAKALLGDARILILDEPTSSLTESESARLFSVVADLKRHGCGVILISHRLDEVIREGDRITVLRDGRIVRTVRRGEVDEESLVEMITGSSRSALFPPRGAATDDVAVRFEAVSSRGLDDVSFTLRRGEILGLAGLAGSGTTAIARVLFGLEPITAGRIIVDGRAIKRPTPRQMLANGVVFFPSDRHAEGLLPMRSVKENLTLEALARRFSPAGVIAHGEEADAARATTARLKVKMNGIDDVITSLSGGNQQKVMLGRGLLRDFRIMVLDDPTIGVDMQTKAEIYRLLAAEAARGVAVLIVSSDLDELIGLAHRILVMQDGRISGDPLGTEGRSKKDFLPRFFAGAAAAPTSHGRH